MPKVTVHHEPRGDTPSQAVMKSANQLVYVTDAKGRKLGLRRLPFLEEFRIIETLGAERAANQTYMGMVNPLLYLAEIDGETIEIPRNHRQIEALIQRADREGFLAVLEGITKHFAADHTDLENRIKNGDGTPDSETGSGS